MRDRFGRLLVVVLLAGAVLAAPLPGAVGATSLSLGPPGSGPWIVSQMWHGGALSGVVPAGTSIDLAPVDGAPLDVYAVAPGRIVKTCVADRQSAVFVLTPGLGVIGYSHLATGDILGSGTVAAGQRLGRLATTFVKSACASSWTGPHLHLSLPRRYDTLLVRGQRAALHASLGFGPVPPPKVFTGRPAASLSINADAVRAVICADTLPGSVVQVRLARPAARGRPASIRVASVRASSRCVVLANLDGPARTLPGVVYTLRAALNQTPSASWPGAGCAADTNGQGVCRQVRRR